MRNIRLVLDHVAFVDAEYATSLRTSIIDFVSTLTRDCDKEEKKALLKRLTVGVATWECD
jgi:hypothetical protein